MAERSDITRITTYAVVALIGFMGAIRFWGLDASPPGFFMDEAYIGGHVLCLAHAGHDLDGRRWPLFSPSGGGGYASPTHLYPAAVWVRCFGGSIVSLRAYAAATMTLAIVGLFFLARRLMGTRGALYAMLAASVSPFLFQVSRMAFDDPAAFLLGLTWGGYFFLRAASWRDAIVAAAFLSLAAYAYPSGRIVLPALVALLAWVKHGNRELRAANLATFFAAGLLLCLPLAIQTFRGGLMARYEAVGLFSPQYRHAHGLDGPRVWLVFVQNCLLQFSPDYLFVHGDANLRHNSQFSGELSWLDAAALVLGLAFLATRWRAARPAKWDRVVVFAMIGFVVGVLPAAITWEGLPHALRSAACWPFAALLTGRVVARLEGEWRWAPPLLAGVAAAFAVAFLYHFFAIYPVQAQPYFQSLVRDAAEYGQATGDWDKFRDAARAEAYDPHACRYFLTQYAGMDCDQAAAFNLK